MPAGKEVAAAGGRGGTIVWDVPGGRSGAAQGFVAGQHPSCTLSSLTKPLHGDTSGVTNTTRRSDGDGWGGPTAPSTAPPKGVSRSQCWHGLGMMPAPEVP